MTKFQVNILETNVYAVVVEAEDSESAVDLAYAAFGDDWDDLPADAKQRIISCDDEPNNTETSAEYVTNLETGEDHFRN